MKIDITLKITPEMAEHAQSNEKKELTGHLGTHFDVMNKEFPLEYTERNGIVFDVRTVKDRDIQIEDIDLNKVSKEMFVAFYTGFIEEEEYGTKKYFKEHPQLSVCLLYTSLPHGHNINEFTPVQHPANDMTTDITTTHFDYHSIDHNLLKLDILGHDDPTMIRMLEEYITSDAMENEYNEEHPFVATEDVYKRQGKYPCFFLLMNYTYYL